MNEWSLSAIDYIMALVNLDLRATYKYDGTAAYYGNYGHYTD